MSDILFKTDDAVFSYRVAGICVRDGKVLLQKPLDETGYAFPGGHVAFGETNAETLKREFREETGAEVRVGALRWVAEIFFPWGGKPCHQICLYYDIACDTFPNDARWMGCEYAEGKLSKLEFFWLPIDGLSQLELYPPQAKELLLAPEGGVVHFVYKE